MQYSAALATHRHRRQRMVDEVLSGSRRTAPQAHTNLLRSKHTKLSVAVARPLCVFCTCTNLSRPPLRVVLVPVSDRGSSPIFWCFPFAFSRTLRLSLPTRETDTAAAVANKYFIFGAQIMYSEREHGVRVYVCCVKRAKTRGA